MAKISYPTKCIVESYLRQIFPLLPSRCLCPSSFMLGFISEYHTYPGFYGTLDISFANQNMNTSIVGVDIPILLQASDVPRDTIVIVAQDPLRDKKDFCLDYEHLNHMKPIVGTPFAYHYNVDCYPQTSVYRKIINKLLTDYHVYITDAHKIYPSPPNLKEEINLLKDEVSAINNVVAIVTFGRVAWKYIKDTKISNYNIKHIPLLHPSQQNWNNWREWIFETVYNNKDRLFVETANKIGRLKTVFERGKGKCRMDDIISILSVEVIKRELK